jgi:hypothetical protein
MKSWMMIKVQNLIQDYFHSALLVLKGMKGMKHDSAAHELNPFTKVHFT